MTSTLLQLSTALLWLLFLIGILAIRISARSSSVVIDGKEYNSSVKVYHFIIDHWGHPKKGLIVDCGNIHCHWTYASHIRNLKEHLVHTNMSEFPFPTVTVGLYNVHSWWERNRHTMPAHCELRTNLTMGESEESRVRYGQLFDESFKYYDGFSTTHPTSAVQRVYEDAFLNASDFLEVRNFSSLVKGGSYVASDCHKRDSANINRDHFVHMIRLNDFRVDGLGRCMHTNPGPEGIVLQRSRVTSYNTWLKHQAISRYMFQMAFENSMEPGYVTEKPFDALRVGTVPIFLGDAAHLKTLIPHPKSVIFMADYNDNVTALVDYLKYLVSNETAYEEHRNWRKDFSYQQNIKDKPLLEHSWHCRICQWALSAQTKDPNRFDSCPAPEEIHNKNKNLIKAPVEWNGKAVRGGNRQIYLVKDGVLYPVPDLATFNSLNLQLESVMVVSNHEIAKYLVGEALPRAE